MYLIWLSVLGLAIGSFLNVVALRYNPDKFIFNRRTLGGRSACPKCANKLNWFELVPLLSFVFLRGRCRNCKNPISFQYPLVEIFSALIFLFIPLFVHSSKFLVLTGNMNLGGAEKIILSVLFILVFLTLLLVFLIDLRLKIIPDELNLFLIILGAIFIFYTSGGFNLTGGSFLGSYAGIFGLRSNIWLNHLLAFGFGALFFGALIFITRGRGMGMGDLKLSAALGFLFGWPDVLLIVALAFILGSVVGLFAMLAQGKRWKSYLPFGPFLALASLIIFFWGHDLVSIYFKLFSLE